jgi:uncharacterized protein YmfQ (DUF2313 family)
VLPITQGMLDRLPAYYRGDSFIEGLQDAVGRELQRIWDRVAVIQSGVFPQTSDDTYGLLSLWEMLLGLPVAAAGVSLTVRRNLVVATLNGRNESSGAGWISAMNQAMGGTPWTYQEGPGANQVSIYISFSSSSFSSVQVLALARKITPAHIDIAVNYSQGFIVGEGIVGEDRL